MRHRLPSQARHRVKQHASPDASSVQPDPSHTVAHGRYLPFEGPAARALSARALTYAVRRGGPTTFTEAPPQTCSCHRCASERAVSPSDLPDTHRRGGRGASTSRRASRLGLAAYGVTKVGGLRVATQLVSGASGRWRNEAMTDWAQGDPIATKCPTPGMLAILELGSVSAAA